MKTSDKPAFTQYPGQSDVSSCGGITRRDYFAAKAMQSLLAACGEHDNYTAEALATDSYHIADIMLEAHSH